MAPYRAEQLGSLLRPDDLLEIRATVRDKGISEEEAGLPAVEKRAIADVVKLQQDLGIKAVTSGEFNRTRFWGLMWDEFEGTIQLQDAEASMFRLVSSSRCYFILAWAYSSRIKFAFLVQNHALGIIRSLETLRNDTRMAKSNCRCHSTTQTSSHSSRQTAT